jgi:hypothetical protein
MCHVLYLGIGRTAPMTGDFSATENAVAGATDQIDQIFKPDSAQLMRMPAIFLKSILVFDSTQRDGSIERTFRIMTATPQARCGRPADPRLQSLR